MDPAAIGTKEFETHQMGIIGPIVLIRSLPETVIDLISQRAPTYRKYVKRREKIETIKCQETSIQVLRLYKKILWGLTLLNFIS